MKEQLTTGTMLTYPDGCDNAPRKKLLIELYKAAMTSEEDFLTDMFADQAKLELVGAQTHTGKEEVLATLSAYWNKAIQNLDILNVITHGSTAAVNGQADFGNETINFCDVFVFTSAGQKGKIKIITSYQVANKESNNDGFTGI